MMESRSSLLCATLGYHSHVDGDFRFRSVYFDDSAYFCPLFFIGIGWYPKLILVVFSLYIFHVIAIKLFFFSYSHPGYLLFWSQNGI